MKYTDGHNCNKLNPSALQVKTRIFLLFISEFKEELYLNLCRVSVLGSASCFTVEEPEPEKCLFKEVCSVSEIVLQSRSTARFFFFNGRLRKSVFLFPTTSPDLVFGLSGGHVNNAACLGEKPVDGGKVQWWQKRSQCRTTRSASRTCPHTRRSCLQIRSSWHRLFKGFRPVNIHCGVFTSIRHWPKFVSDSNDVPPRCVNATSPSVCLCSWGAFVMS